MTTTYNFGFNLARPRSRGAGVARIDALATLLDTALVIARFAGSRATIHVRWPCFGTITPVFRLFLDHARRVGLTEAFM
jgi:hypothetical protein